MDNTFSGLLLRPCQDGKILTGQGEAFRTSLILNCSLPTGDSLIGVSGTEH